MKTQCSLLVIFDRFYRSKYGIATYREKAPQLSYGEKLDLIKNVFVPEKYSLFPETMRSF